MRNLVISPSNLIKRSRVITAKNGGLRNQEYFTKQKNR